MATEQFSLCWDNFHKNMSAGMQSLLENEDLVDVTLAVEGKYLKAHKMVLSVCSPYFRELFQSNPCKHPIVFMKDVSYIALNDLLQFMYQGEVQVAQDNLTTFIKTAEALQIKGLTGDNSHENEVNEPPPEPEKPPEPVKRSAHEFVGVSGTPIPRIKKIAGPASKRMKIATPSAQSTPVTKSETHSATASTTSSTEQLIQFKMEPYESGETATVTASESQIDAYTDDTMDDTQGDDIEDYSLMDAGDEEPKAGTSTDTAGDGQDMKYDFDNGQFSIAENTFEHKVKKQRVTTRTRYVIGGFVYHNKLVAGKPPIRYLGCAEMKRAGCRARAILPVNGDPEDIRITKPHNHPPDENAEEKEEFVKHLRNAARTMPGSLKQVYDNIALIYPNGAREIPFKSLCSSLHRWRRLTF